MFNGVVSSIGFRVISYIDYELSRKLLDEVVLYMCDWGTAQRFYASIQQINMHGKSVSRISQPTIRIISTVYF